MVVGERSGPYWRRFRFRLYRMARPPVLALLRLTIGFRIEGLENVPRDGGALVISNHLHNLDPILLVAAFPRPVQFMAKKEVFPVPVVGWIARQAGAFPIDRGAVDRAALRYAEGLLERGSLVGIFPEGTRSTTGAIRESHAGSALVAVRSGAPIIPTAIFGTETLPFNGSKGRRHSPGRRPVTVRIGRPFQLPEHRATEPKPKLAEMTDHMMLEVARLLPPEYRGIYADRVAAALAEEEPAPAPAS